MTTQSSSSISSRLDRVGLRGRSAILAGAMGLTFLLLTPIGIALDGAIAILAISVAMLVCLASGLLTLMLSQLLRSPELVLYNVLIGMGLRMGLPLAVFLIVYLQGGLLVEAGMVYYLLVFYFIMLAVETALSIPQMTTEADNS